MRTRHAALPAALSAALALLAGTFMMSGTAAGATAAACSASAEAVYTPPATVPGGPGSVLACRQVTLGQVPGNIAMTGWQVQYGSTDNRGTPVAVSGTVAVPVAPWTGTGARPVVAFSPGTLGLGAKCAFSKQLAGAYQDEYEGDNIAALLKAGYAVAATDGAGYLDGQTHRYVSGADAGHALLDIARAASRVPGSGLSGQAPVGLWGYSEGGAASLWAAQLAAGYAPGLKVAGDASGGVPGDLRVTAEGLNGQAFAGFLMDAALGISAAYPKLPFDALLNDDGRAAVARARSGCLVDTLAGFAFADIGDYTTAGLTLDRFYAQAGSDGRTWGEVLDAQKLGVGVGVAPAGTAYRIGFPVLQYRGAFEEVIAISTEDATHQAYCAAGVPTAWKLYPGDHLLADNQAVDDVVGWLGERFAGHPETGDC